MQASQLKDWLDKVPHEAILDFSEGVIQAFDTSGKELPLPSIPYDFNFENDDDDDLEHECEYCDHLDDDGECSVENCSLCAEEEDFFGFLEDGTEETKEEKTEETFRVMRLGCLKEFLKDLDDELGVVLAVPAVSNGDLVELVPAGGISVNPSDNTVLIMASELTDELENLGEIGNLCDHSIDQAIDELERGEE